MSPPLTKNIKRLQKRAYRTRKQMQHLHMVGPQPISPDAQSLTAGPRGLCSWCKASIPLEMTPLGSPALLDKMGAYPTPKNHTHRITGWCSICKVWGIDVTVDVSRA